LLRGVARPLAKEVAETLKASLLSSASFGSADITVEIDLKDALTNASDASANQVSATAKSFDEGCGHLTRKQRRALHLEREAALFGACGIQLVAHGDQGGLISADAFSTDDFAGVPALTVKALEEQWQAGGLWMNISWTSLEFTWLWRKDGRASCATDLLAFPAYTWKQQQRLCLRSLESSLICRHAQELMVPAASVLLVRVLVGRMQNAGAAIFLGWRLARG